MDSPVPVHADHLNILFAKILWHSWMNINSCQTDNMHSGKKHSCETQLITVINDWAKILDKGGHADIFILDFEKDFDTPNPVMNYLNVSYMAMALVGIKTLKWIDSFLCDRQQRVLVNGGISDTPPPRFIRCPPGHTSWTSVALVVHKTDITVLQRILTQN